jgi:hypothetical protein
MEKRWVASETRCQELTCTNDLDGGQFELERPFVGVNLYESGWLDP